MVDKRITTTAWGLIERGLLSYWTLEPFYVGYNETYYDTIEKLTGVPSQDVGHLVNKTVPCFANVTLRNFTSYENYIDTVQHECYGVEVNDCSQNSLQGTVFAFMYLFSLVFMMVLVCLRKRKSVCMACCWGTPGIPVPLNMLDSYENRIGYSLTFGVLVNVCFSVLMGDYPAVAGSENAQALAMVPSYLSFLVKFCFAVVIALTGWPLFYCQNMTNQIAGSIIGLTYTLVWLIFDMKNVLTIKHFCDHLHQKGVGIYFLLTSIPKYICLVLLILKFMKVFLLAVFAKPNKLRKRKAFLDLLYSSKPDWKEGYVHRHVAKLLLPQITDGEIGEKSFLQKARKKLYENRPGFRYSTRMIASAVVSAISIYFVIVLLSIYIWQLFDLNVELVNFIIKEVFTGLLSAKYINGIPTCLKVSFILSMVLAVLLYTVVTCNSFSLYRKHITKLRKGNWLFLPANLRKRNFDGIDPPALMMASMKFAGIQVAYCIWGFLLTFVLLLVIAGIISLQIILPITVGESSFVLQKLNQLYPTIMMAVVLIIIRKILGAKVFLINSEVLAVDNRRLFLLFSYLIFYFNIFVGLVTSLLRLVFGLVFGVVFYQRLQKSALPVSFEKLDAGYMSYVGFIMVEHYHANPILHCFIQLLGDVMRNKNSDSLMELVAQKGEEKSKRAYNRWFLFIMLSQNPSLQKYRKDRLKKKKDVISSDSEASDCVEENNAKKEIEEENNVKKIEENTKVKKDNTVHVVISHEN